MNDELIKERIDSLVQLGEELSDTKGRYGVDTVDEQLFIQWHVRSLAILEKVFGKELYYWRYDEVCKRNLNSHVNAGLGVLKAAKSDIDAGFYDSAKMAATKEVFTDFLEMVDHLLENEYKDPAAMLTGAVLEDGLRKIAEGKVTVKDTDNIGSLNNKLADNRVYSNTMRRSIGAWASIRNSADHAKFEEYTIAQVENMRDGVRVFLESHL